MFTKKLKQKNEKLQQENEKLKQENKVLEEENERLRLDNTDINYYKSLYEDEEKHTKEMNKLFDRMISLTDKLIGVSVEELGKTNDMEIVFTKSYGGGMKLYHHGKEIDLSACNDLRIYWCKGEMVTVTWKLRR